MTKINWVGNTIARRFAITIFLAALFTVGLNYVYDTIAGKWGLPLPPFDQISLQDQIKTLINVIEAAPQQLRPKLAGATDIKEMQVIWYADSAHIPTLLGHAKRFAESTELTTRLQGNRTRTISFFESGFGLAEDTYFITVELNDKSWLVFKVLHGNWGLESAKRITIAFVFLMLSIITMSLIAAHAVAKPIHRFVEAVRRFGANPLGPSIEEIGTQELRFVIRAFNEMQAQIQKFVADRTAMLTAISHDLRTPLTRMRLRGEFIDDAEQQSKLFHDVDEMQSMIDSALEFFRDDARTEETTSFDLAELLNTIKDHYTDQGIDILYQGPHHYVYSGRPMNLKRAFTNLIDNAIKYGTPPKIELTSLEKSISVTIKDHGPGIPEEYLENVFKPFYRLEGSRNRNTGGVGLGLTIVKSIINNHGGNLVLRNGAEGGLEAVITLPALN
jgi:signal transduction histidine kinase